MGLIYAELTLRNSVDAGLLKRGMLKEEEVRHTTVESLVDSGAMNLVIPSHIAIQLGLDHVDFIEVELANSKTEKVEKVGPVEIRFANRITNVDAVVLDDEVLLGAIPMQDMDVVIDPRRERLIVNPENPYLPKNKVK